LSPAAALNQPATNSTTDLGNYFSVIISCLIAEWIVAAFGNYSKIIGSFPVAFRVRLDHFLAPRARGNSADMAFVLIILAAVKLLFWPTTLVVIAILASWWLRGNEFQAGSAANVYRLPLWALFQPYALQWLINRRPTAARPGSKSILLVAIIFSLVHLPNPLVDNVTLIGGCFGRLFINACQSVALALSMRWHLCRDAFAIAKSGERLRVDSRYFR